MKKWWFLFFCILGLGFTGYIFYPKYWEEKPPQKPKHSHLKKTYGPYFFSVPIHKFSAANLPCLAIKIEDKEILVELDLGFRGEVVFNKRTIESFSNKTFIGEDTMHGMRGKSYRKKKYRAPKIHFKNLAISNSIMYEESDAFDRDSCIQKNENQSNSEDLGRIGWELFQKCNLFLDLGNSQIAFCDSAQTLENQGYPIEEFAKIPLHTERGLVEIVVEGPKGHQNWILDTGSTWNVLNTEDNRPVEELISDPNNATNLPLKIGNKDFGLIPFRKLPIPLPIYLDAILGMEFFKFYQVFIDFSENQVYIREVIQDQR